MLVLHKLAYGVVTIWAVAAALFAGLRTLEEAQVQVILCRNFEERGLGLAIRDRLLKAAGGKVFKTRGSI